MLFSLKQIEKMALAGRPGITSPTRSNSAQSRDPSSTGPVDRSGSACTKGARREEEEEQEGSRTW